MDAQAEEIKKNKKKRMREKERKNGQDNFTDKRTNSSAPFRRAYKDPYLSPLNFYSGS